MRNSIIGIAVVVVAVLGAWWMWSSSSQPAQSQTSGITDSTDSTRTLIASVAYSCDEGKRITASYFAGPEAPPVQPGEPPHPTGSVDVALDTGATSTLAQTISADGARYANSDESFVFWNKGKEALVMRNNSMDLGYTNCTQVE